MTAEIENHESMNTKIPGKQLKPAVWPGDFVNSVNA